MTTRIFIYLFLSFSLSCKQKSTDKIVGVVVLNDFEHDYIEGIITNIETYYKCKCVVLNTIQLPEKCITTLKEKRYRADSIIRYLKSIKPDMVDYILGLTNDNISNTKYDSLGKIKIPETYFVDISIFGLGFCPGKSCVVSSFNFKNAETIITKARLQKITIHELGHNFGLPHCKSKNCVIQDGAENLELLDESDMKLCEKCCRRVNKWVR